MKNKFIISLSIVFLLLSSLNGALGRVYAALTPGPYVIKDILAYDSNIHPTNRKQVWDLIDRLKANNGSLPDRTGWGAYKLSCEYKDPKDTSQGTYWYKFDEVMTSDSGRDKIYKVSDPYYKNQIINKYGQDTYDAALASGQNLVYQTGSKTDYDTILKIWHDDCKVGELGAYYNNSDFSLTMSFTINDDGETTPPVDPPPSGGGGSCSIEFVQGSNGGTMNSQLLAPHPSGSISSDSGGFDVVQGIPSSEYLRTDADSEEYLYEQSFVQKTGNVVFNNITVKKKFTLQWTEKGEGEDAKPESKSEDVEMDVTVSGIQRPYTYWEIQKYSIWQLRSSTFTNYALPNGTTTIDANVFLSAGGSHSSDVQTHVFPADCGQYELPSQTINGGESKPNVPDFTSEAKAKAESEIKQNQVKNDNATFKGSTIMSDSVVQTNGPTPSNVPAPSMIHMAKSNLLIDPLKTNYFKSASTGSVNYQPVFSIDNSAYEQNFPFNVNPVTVHTPTVIYSKASDDKEHDQRTNPPNRATPANPDVDRHAFILDRPFTVTLPTNGQHRNIPGYGNRDYSKYIKEKQVKFPFDVYSETKLAFYPANTWISVPVDIESVNFFLPVWVPEGGYRIEFRSFAINALTSGDFGGTEHHANVTIPNGLYNVPPAGNQSAAHVATDSIEVDVVGRLYDLHITDITDYNWQSAFRTSDGVTPNGNSYWVGLNGIDGELRGNTNLFTLPVRQGSHPEGYKNVAVKTGYTFRFDMKTKGDMFNLNDAIRIKPTFYFVNKDGSNRREVDLYYHDKTNYFVKVGSEQDTVYREVKLNEVPRNVPEKELIANADYYYRHANDFDLTDTVANHFPASWGRQYLKHITKEDVLTGPYGWQILNWKLRTYRGPEENEVPTNSMVPAEDIVAREQTWYSEYSLPANVYAVDKNTDVSQAGLLDRLNENHPIFLKDGYIIVNFDIETIRNGDLDNPYLQYINGKLMNQWSDMEGFDHSFVDPYGNTFTSKDGDVLYYHGDANSDTDAEASVTH